MKKKKNIFINCLIAISLFMTVLFVYQNVDPKSLGADSGFDSSYDGGSSGGDFGGGDYGGGGSFGGRGGSFKTFFYFMAFTVIVFIILMMCGKKADRKKIATGNDITYNAIFNKLGQVDINKLKVDRYNQYIAMQKAMCNLDINYLKNILTGELCQKCEFEFNYIKNNNYIRVFTNETPQAVYIVDVRENSNLIFMKTLIIYKAKDYIMTHGKVMLGEPSILYYQKEVTFVLYPDNTWLISDVRTRKVVR